MQWEEVELVRSAAGTYGQAIWRDYVTGKEAVGQSRVQCIMPSAQLCKVLIPTLSQSMITQAFNSGSNLALD